MSRVITFSQQFPANHPKKGQPTFFVEKIYSCLGVNGEFLDIDLPAVDNFLYKYPETHFDSKGHTIRAGSRWKVGDKFSPRVWSGKPYQSKQIQFAPDIEIKKVWDVQIEFVANNLFVMLPTKNSSEFLVLSAGDVAKNDGLDVHDFIAWFNIHPKKKKHVFIGQIICWDESINY